ncbi:MAG: hypothetical protein ACTSX8_08295 [Alphaproteobacteria bacterium]
MRTIRLFNRRVKIPAGRATRTALGGGLVVGGVIGFMPVLGFWMIPAGLIVLSVDSARVRRLNRRVTVRVVRMWKGSRTGAEESPKAPRTPEH